MRMIATAKAALFAALTGALMLTAVPSQAQMMGMEEITGWPTVDYSADVTMNMGDESMSMKLYSSGRKQRRDMSAEGMNMQMIFDLDAETMTNIMPDMQMYMETPLEKEMTEGPGDDFEMTEVGREEVNGMDTTHIHMSGTDRDGGETEMDIWKTDENIIVRMEGQVTKDGVTEDITMTVENIEIGDLDPSTFEAPDGYQKLSN